MLLSACLGLPVRDDGRRIGRLTDLGALPSDGEPSVSGVVVAVRGRGRAWAPWSAVRTMSAEEVTIDPTALGPVPAGVLLARDVLDAQLIDLSGRRVIRVGDVDLALRPGSAPPVVTGVQTGADSVLRRLGLRRLAARARPEAIPWRELHLPAHPGATLTVQTARPALRGLAPSEHRRLSARLGAHVAAGLWGVPRGYLRLRFPTHVLRRRRARP